MAKTDGRGNPPWTRDETILALDLFFDASMVALPDSDPRVLHLSELLRGLPGNEERSKVASFRNPAGVSFKLSNLQSVATGKGFANTSAMDASVWRQFESRRGRVKEIAAFILRYASEAPLNSDLDDEPEFAEGNVFTRLHKSVERNRKLRRTLIADRRKNGPLHCDACGSINLASEAALDDCIFEAHHLIPLAEHGARRTKLADTTLLCANCHRLIHRLIARSGRWVSLEQLRATVTPAGVSRW